MRRCADPAPSPVSDHETRGIGSVHAAIPREPALPMSRKNTKQSPRKRQPATARPGDVPLSAGRKAAFLAVTALLLVALAEGLSAIALRVVEGEWPYSRPRNVNYLLFEPHPDWVATPRKDVTVTVSGQRHHHNSDGWRGEEFSRVKTKPRVACIGGSTTYCVGVNDEETWPYYLGQLLRPDYEVLNFGIPGHSSVEHKKLLPMVLSRYSPDVVVFQMGLNDVRNMNVDDPGADYQNFHRPSLFGAMGFRRRERLPRSALVQASAALLEKLKVLDVYPFPNGVPPGRLSDSVDPRVVQAFAANLDILLQECRAKNVRVVLVPHTMTTRTFTETNFKWWTPYLTKRGIFNGQAALNAEMRKRADGDRVIYAEFLDRTTWGTREFCDPSHLNAKGNLRLARMLKDDLPWSPSPGSEAAKR